MRLFQICLSLVVHAWVVSAKKKHVLFMKCPLAKTNNDIVNVKLAGSITECAVSCLNDPACVSASYCRTNDALLCQLSGFYTDGSCSRLLADAACSQINIVNPRENGGTVFSQNRTCHCAEGFVGVYCQRRYRDCVEAPRDFRFHIIQPLGSDNMFEWYCGRDTLPVTGFVPTYKYTHTWQALKQGVWIDERTFYFIGLERLHMFTKQGRYDMYVRMWNVAAEFGMLWYRNVRIDTEAEGYAWHWDEVERDVYKNNTIFLDGLGGAGDPTKNLNGARFGTHDNDVNGCAKLKTIGWWYNPQGCMVMDVGPNGMSWLVNRNGKVVNEYLNYVSLWLKIVYFYNEDDLVL